jgi:hypothetical protein
VVCVNKAPFDPYQSPLLATHVICRHCLQRYVHGKVVEEKRTKIICPGADCNLELTYEELRANSESDTFAMSDSSPTKADLDMTTFFCKKPATLIPISRSVPILNAGKAS